MQRDNGNSRTAMRQMRLSWSCVCGEYHDGPNIGDDARRQASCASPKVKTAQGYKRWTSQAAPGLDRVQRKRSWRRASPSAQNSNSTGFMRIPPQKLGRATESPCTARTASTRFINACRDSSGCDWTEATAPIRESGDRLIKYSSASGPSSRSIKPRHRICRRRDFQ